MKEILSVREQIRQGAYQDRLRSLYVTDDIEKYELRMLRVLDVFKERFGDRRICLISAPGRTELGGNHTDHQRGCVLAASVNVDMLSCVSPNDSSMIRLLSEGYDMIELDLRDLSVREEEKNQTASLIRGIAAKITDMGYRIGGFDAVAISDVPAGSGLSSSAAFETMIAQIFNHLYCDDQIDAVTIAKIGQYAENVYFGKPCGLMDQMASSVGGIVAIDFADPQEPIVRQIPFSLSSCGYELCIIDSGADHADLTDEYAAVPAQMQQVAKVFDKEVLRDVQKSLVLEHIQEIREKTSDRALLRAMHFYRENDRATEEAQALSDGDFERFLSLVKASGISSFTYLQNVYASSMPDKQPVSVALMLAEELLDDRGAYRVHGGGFAGTIQAFVPSEDVLDFASKIETFLGEGRCHVLRIRPEGAVVLADE